MLRQLGRLAGASVLVGASCRQAGQCESARTSVSGVQEPASLFSLRERSVLPNVSVAQARAFYGAGGCGT